MAHDLSGSCEASGEQPQVCEQDPGCGAGDGGFEVFGQAAAAAEPGKAALNDPGEPRDLEGALPPLHDLQFPALLTQQLTGKLGVT